MVILHWLFEEWLPIRGYEGLYEVSSFGRVRSLDHYANGRNKSLRLIKGKIITPNLCGNYLIVILSKNGKTKSCYIHRLVAEAFIPNPEKLPCVNHKLEFDKQNNCVWNLEWCSYSYNNTYGTKQARIIETNKNKCNKNAERPLVQFTKEGLFLDRFKSGKEAYRKTGIHYNNINSVCRNKPHRKTAGGYIWRYED